MSGYIANRLIAMVPVLFFVSLILFLVLNWIPGDVVAILLGEEARPELIEALRQELGLDKPILPGITVDGNGLPQFIPGRYLDWVGSVLRGDLGRSIRTNQPVLEALMERLPVTIELTILAMVISLIIALPTGIVSATRRNSFLDLFSTTGALLGVSMPNFFLAILLIFIFAVTLRWLPPIGFTPIHKDLGANLRGMILPAITLGAAAAAIVARLTRSSLLEVLNQEYIRTARAKGLAERAVVFTHALKNAMIPVITIVGLQVGALLGGAVITETIFVLPGIGSLAVDSIFRRDYPLVQGAVLFIALVHLFVNLFVDILYGFLDPRIHYA